MLAVAFVVGGIVGWVATNSPLGALLGAIVAVALAFALQLVVGLRSVHDAEVAVPVDLAAPIPANLTPDTYATLPLASRNAVIARLVAQASGRSAEHVASLMPQLTGRMKFSSLATQGATASLVSDLSPARVDRDATTAVCAGELKLAALASLPSNDRVRAVVERNLGKAIDEEMATKAILACRFPLMDRTAADLIDDALDGRVDLAATVGSIRKVGEYYVREMTKIR